MFVSIQKQGKMEEGRLDYDLRTAPLACRIENSTANKSEPRANPWGIYSSRTQNSNKLWGEEKKKKA